MGTLSPLSAIADLVGWVVSDAAEAVEATKPKIISSHLLSWFVGLGLRPCYAAHIRSTQPTFYSLPILLRNISLSEDPHIWS